MPEHPETMRFYRMRLPHWEVEDGRYFVTIRLKGAIPQEGLDQINHLRHLMDIAVENRLDPARKGRFSGDAGQLFTLPGYKKCANDLYCKRLERSYKTRAHDTWC